MDHFLDLDTIRAEMTGPHPSGRMTPEELGDNVARLVWESFSDFLVDPQLLASLRGMGIPIEEGVPQERAAEELLIFHMWTHSRAIELSFHRRVPPEAIRRALDHLHRAIFEDMVTNGTPRPQIPVFEQRVSARYAEYRAAAEETDARVGEVAVEHLGGSGESPAAARRLTDRAVEMANPLRDYLEGVDLVAD
ncbi:MAG: hypothetical protein WEG36_09410 [Gemmatimonadota bacterium]|jgi:hypothetical protein